MTHSAVRRSFPQSNSRNSLWNSWVSHRTQQNKTPNISFRNSIRDTRRHSTCALLTSNQISRNISRTKEDWEGFAHLLACLQFCRQSRPILTVLAKTWDKYLERPRWAKVITSISIRLQRPWTWSASRQDNQWTTHRSNFSSISFPSL